MQNEGATLSFQEELFVYLLMLFAFISLVRIAFLLVRIKATSIPIFWGSVLTILVHYCYFLVPFSLIQFDPILALLSVGLYCFWLILGTVSLFYSVRSKYHYVFGFEIFYVVSLFLQIGWLHVMLKA